MQWGVILRRYRHAAQLSQYDLAVKAGLLQPTISRLENDQQPEVTLAVVQRLAEALGITVAVLTGEALADDPEKALMPVEWSLGTHTSMRVGQQT